MSVQPTVRVRRCRAGNLLRLKTTASILVTVALLQGGAVGRARAGGDRVAVLIVADRDPELSDNLTEVAISKVAERGGLRLVGWRELHDQLADIIDRDGLGDCLGQAQCLARIGAAARGDSALIGDVHRDNDRFAVHLVFVNTRTAVREAEFSESVGPDVAQLISAVRRGAGIVSAPKPATLALPPAPAQALLQEGTLLTGSPMITAVQSAPRRARWMATLGYATAGLAVVSLSAAVVTGSVASAKPTGMTRVEVQGDLERRDRYAGAANSLYLVGGALALGAAVLLVLHLRHE
jgi:hypothetical protein